MYVWNSIQDEVDRNEYKIKGGYSYTMEVYSSPLVKDEPFKALPWMTSLSKIFTWQAITCSKLSIKTVD